MIAVATTEDRLAGVCERLRARGASVIDVAAPSDTRRVVLASVEDERSVAGLVASLRAEGVMAVSRPDGGVALRKWLRDTRPITFGGRITVCRAWSKHDRRGLAGLVELGPGGFGGFAELPDLDKPVIAAVNGMAVGGGFELVMAADLVVAAEHATFFLPEAAIGLIPDVGSVLLPRLLPAPLANEVLLAGRRLNAEELRRFGLVNEVVPGTDLLDAAHDLADRIAAHAPLAIAAILDIGRRSDGLPVSAALDGLRSGTVETYRKTLESEDAQEGMRAFAEKRDPVWKGR